MPFNNELANGCVLKKTGQERVATLSWARTNNYNSTQRKTSAGSSHLHESNSSKEGKNDVSNMHINMVAASKSEKKKKSI